MIVALFMTVLLDVPAAGPRVAVHSTATPKPALRFTLLPEVRESHPGNSVQWYLRCFAEQRSFFFSKPAIEERARYRGMTLAELAKQNLSNYGGSALTQADWAARLETCSWDAFDRHEMAELAGFRTLGVSLQIRLRHEIATGNHTAANRTVKTMLAFARHLGECPIPEANRLGHEIANLAIDSLLEQAEQPKSPNLYWALTDLPAPLVDLRRGFQGEVARLEKDFAALRSNEAMTDAELDEFVGSISGRIGVARERAGLPPKNVRATMRTLTEDKSRVAAIRDRMLRSAPAADASDKLAALRILAYPALQLVLLDERERFVSQRDERLKRLALPTPERTGPRESGLFAEFLPDVASARAAQLKLEQRIALLRCVESFRAKLAGEVELLTPNDPITGKPFDIRDTDDTRTIRGANLTLELVRSR